MIETPSVFVFQSTSLVKWNLRIETGNFTKIFVVCKRIELKWIFIFLQADIEKEKGNEAYKKKDFETAINHYSKAIELEPMNMTYYTNRAGLSI